MPPMRSWKILTIVKDYLDTVSYCAATTSLLLFSIKLRDYVLQGCIIAVSYSR